MYVLLATKDTNFHEDEAMGFVRLRALRGEILECVAACFDRGAINDYAIQLMIGFFLPTSSLAIV